MNGVTWIHIAGGALALLSGTIAFAVRKGSGMHAAVGTAFCVSMFVLGITASMLAPFKSPPDSPVGGIMVCYFVATAWMTARRRSGTPGLFEKFACAIILAIAAAILFAGFELSRVPTALRAGPPGPGALFALGIACLLAGLADLKYILRGRLPPAQRVARHLWRMCFAFFIATGSFFLGQQDMLPQSVRNTPIVFVLAFAPFALMVFWLLRVRFSRMIGQVKRREIASRSRRTAPVAALGGE